MKFDKSIKISYDQYGIINKNPRKWVLEKELERLEEVQEKNARISICTPTISIVKRYTKIKQLKEALKMFDK